MPPRSKHTAWPGKALRINCHIAGMSRSQNPPSSRQGLRSPAADTGLWWEVMKTILVPVDLSAATTKVCDAACELAKLMHARLVLLHVTQPPPVMLADYYAFDAGVMAEAFAAGEKFAERRLKALARLCTRQQLDVETIQVTGQPVTVILARAAALKADYVVLGSHGHGAMFDLLVGATTQGVLRKAPCPVLVVPMGPARARR